MRKVFFGFMAMILLSANVQHVTAEDSAEDEAYVIDVSGADSGGAMVAKDVSTQKLTLQNHPRSSVVGLDLPNAGTPNTFKIQLGTSIGRIEKYVTQDNVLVFDFYDTENKLNDQYTVDHPVVNRVRAGAFGDGANTRIVFDLIASAHFEVTLTADRRTLIVRFIKNNIQKVQFYEEGDTDIIKMTGDYAPIITIKPIADTNIVVVDMPFSYLELPSKWVTTMNFVRVINTTQVDDNTAQVTMETSGAASMNVEYEGNTAILRLSPATYKNIIYTVGKTLKIKKENAYPISIDQIKTEDLYNNYKYIFTLPGRYQELLGWGEYYINDEFIRSVMIDVDENGNKRLIFNEKQVLAFDITEDTEYIYIKAMQPREKYDKIIIIDPGHGGADPGARANGLTEKDINLDTAMRVVNLVENEGKIKAYATRRTDVALDLYDRPRWANAIGDMFISIHMNAMGSRNTGANGTEVYYYPHGNDGSLGFSSQRLANILQNKLLYRLNSTDRKVKSASFVVIRNTTIPAALVEVGFLTNWSEASKLNTASYRQTAAEAIYASVLEAFSEYTPAR
jgi:N-acetylmuramoyl-L-alanine amidase